MKSQHCLLSRCQCDTDSNMSSTVFKNQTELEIFALTVGGFSVLAILILAIVVIHLNTNINKLKKQVRLQSRLDQHSFFNPTIEPNEELARRGFSMYNGTATTQEKEEYFGNFDKKPQQDAYKY